MKGTNIKRLVAFTLTSLLVCQSLAGVNNGTNIGPDGGAVTSVYYLPGKADSALASTADSIYRTTDNGGHWTRIKHGVTGATRVFANVANNSDRILAVGGLPSIFSSADAGVTFDTSSGPTLSLMGSSALAVASNGAVVYSGTSDGKIFRSADAGTTWVAITPASIASFSQIGQLAVSRSSENMLFATVSGTTNAIYRTLDGGVTWTSTVIPMDSPNTVAVDPNNSNIVIVGTNAGSVRSTDGGTSWTAVTMPYLSVIRFHPVIAGRVFAADYLGNLMRSDNSGANWTIVAALTSASPLDITFDAAKTDRIMYSSSVGVMVSEDAGVNWEARNTGIHGGSFGHLVAAPRSGDVYATTYGVFGREASTWSLRGFDSFQSALPSTPPILNTGVHAFAAAPSDSKILYASRSLNLLKSLDGGAHWVKPSIAFDAHHINGIAVDPTNAQVLYVHASMLGVLRSSDGGATWMPRSTGLPASDFNIFAIDPTNPLTVYAGASFPPGAGIYKTIDGGVSWMPANTGIATRQVLTIALDASNTSILYVATDQGIFRSDNGGASWIKKRDHGNYVAIDPRSSNVVLVSPNPNNPNGIVRSVDSGDTWEQILFPPSYFSIEKMIFDPAKTSNIIGSVHNSGLVEQEISPDLELKTTVPMLALQTAQSVLLQLVNNGPYTASTVKLAVTLPLGASGITAQADKGACTISSGRIDCALNALRPSDAMNVTVGLTPVSTSSLVAAASTHESDSLTSNNNVAISVERRSDVSVALTTASPSIMVGGGIAYLATVANAGPSPAANVAVAVVLPGNVRFESVASTSGVCTSSGPTANCDVGSLASGATASITINTTSTTAGNAAATATATSVGTDPTVANNSAVAAVSVQAPPSNSGGGGGGAMTTAILGCLLALLAARKRTGSSGPRLRRVVA